MFERKVQFYQLAGETVWVYFFGSLEYTWFSATYWWLYTGLNLSSVSQTTDESSLSLALFTGIVLQFLQAFGLYRLLSIRKGSCQNRTNEVLVGWARKATVILLIRDNRKKWSFVCDWGSNQTLGLILSKFCNHILW